MSDISKTLIAKSDQLNADDLTAGPQRIDITSAEFIESNNEQPLNIYYTVNGVQALDAETGKPKAYRPNLTMRRIIAGVWSTETDDYAGRSMMVFREPSVKWAGKAVGGIEISHMSDMDAPRTFNLQVSRGKKKDYTIKPLADVQQETASRPLADWNEWFQIAGITKEELRAYREARGMPSVSDLNDEDRDAVFNNPEAWGRKVKGGV